MPVVARASDDERADRAGSYIGVGLLSMLLVAAFMALLVLPPAFAAGFILRGRPLARYLGFALAAGWLFALLVIGRRIMSPRRAHREDD